MILWIYHGSRSGTINLFCDSVGNNKFQWVAQKKSLWTLQNMSSKRNFGLEQDLGFLRCGSFSSSLFSEFKFLDELTHALLGCEMNPVFERHEEDENFRCSYLSLLDEGNELLCVFSSRTRILVFTCLSFSLCFDLPTLVFHLVLQIQSAPPLYFLCAFCSFFCFFYLALCVFSWCYSAPFFYSVPLAPIFIIMVRVVFFVFLKKNFHPCCLLMGKWPSWHHPLVTASVK